MLVGLVYLGVREDGDRRDAWLPLFAGTCFFLTVLGHYGMMIGAVFIALSFLTWMLACRWRGVDSVRGWRLIRLISFSLAASFLVYYRSVLDLIANHAGRFLERFTGGPAPAATPASQAFSLDKLAAKVAYLLGPAPVVMATTAAVGGAALKSVAWGWLGSWLAVGALFALLDQAVGDAVRWYYLVAAAVALLAGRLLGLLAGRGRLGRWFVALLLAAILWQLLNTWVGDMIFYRYHTR
jgi:hypothetical protein